MAPLTTHRILVTIACASVALAAFVFALAAGRGSHFNPDESRWLSRAHYLADLADPRGPTWDDQYMTRGQPPLGSYAMGIGLLLQGRDLHTNPPWDFSQPWEVNVAIGNKPVPADLTAGRATSAALTALTSLAVIAVANVFVSLPWAIAAGAMYAAHPFTVYIGSVAMSDALFGFLIACSAWMAAALARKPRWPRAIAFGTALGLGAATKLSPLAVAMGLTLAIALIIVLSARRTRNLSSEGRRWLVHGAIVSAAAAAVFVLVYPYLWSDPIARTKNLLEFRAEEMATQASDWPVMSVPTRIEALRRTHANFADRYNVAGSLLQLTGLQSAPAWPRQIEVVLAVAGIAVLAVNAARAGPLSPQAFAFAVLGGQVVITLLAMRSEFDRYHVPAALLGVIAAAAALAWLARVTVGDVRPTKAEAMARAERQRARAPAIEVILWGRAGDTTRSNARE